MPPKPNKDVEDTLQAILDKLANLQSQFDVAVATQDGYYSLSTSHGNRH